MATLRKRSEKSWEVRIRRKGYPVQSRTFKSKYLAERWARQIEHQMEERVFKDTSKTEGTTVTNLLERYQQEVLAKKGCYTSDPSRIKNLMRHLGHLSLIQLTSERVARFRDDRLKYALPEEDDTETENAIKRLNQKERRVGPDSVIREMAILSRAIDLGMTEWGLFMPHGNPCKSVRRPQKPQGRNRRTSEEELARLAAHSESDRLHDICKFALETAMRRGEIAAMRWEHIDLNRRTLHIPRTKTGVPRTIPLSRRALAILRHQPVQNNDAVWRIRADAITRAFNRACERAGIFDLHFHDIRHEATSRLFELGLAQVEVVAITGHQDLRSMLRYTHLNPETLADKLDRAQTKSATKLPDNVIPLRSS